MRSLNDDMSNTLLTENFWMFGKERQITSITSLKTINNDDWHAICRSLPNIQKFSVNNVFDMSSLSDLMFPIFTEGWKSLTNIDLGTGFKPSECIFTVLLRNSKNLKTASIPARQRLADLYHQLFEEAQGPRLFFKSLDQQQQKHHVGLWDNEDFQKDFDDEVYDFTDESDDESVDESVDKSVDDSDSDDLDGNYLKSSW